jgi:hypothetical protein
MLLLQHILMLEARNATNGLSTPVIAIHGAGNEITY